MGLQRKRRNKRAFRTTERLTWSNIRTFPRRSTCTSYSNRFGRCPPRRRKRAVRSPSPWRPCARRRAPGRRERDDGPASVVEGRPAVDCARRPRVCRRNGRGLATGRPARRARTDCRTRRAIRRLGRVRACSANRPRRCRTTARDRWRTGCRAGGV